MTIITQMLKSAHDNDGKILHRLDNRTSPKGVDLKKNTLKKHVQLKENLESRVLEYMRKIGC